MGTHTTVCHGDSMVSALGSAPSRGPSTPPVAVDGTQGPIFLPQELQSEASAELGARGLVLTGFTGAWRRLKDSNVLAFWLPGQRARKHSGGVKW